MNEVVEVTVMSNGIIESVERSFTQEELAQRKKDQAAAEDDQAAQEVLAALTVQNTADAIAHAKSLGFTDAMISIMYPTLGVSQ